MPSSTGTKGFFTLKPDPTHEEPGQEDQKPKHLPPEITYADRLKRIDPVRIAVAGEQDALRAYLAPYLEGHSEQLVRFLHESFAPQLACQFGEELKTNEHARHAYERLVGESLIAGVQSLSGKMDTNQASLNLIVEHLKAWEQKLQAQSWDPEILARIDAAITATRDRLSAQLDIMRQEMQSGFETTWDQIHASEERVTRALERIDERLEAQSRSAPPIRSRIWDVPHRWSRYFVGRDTLLARIHDEFNANTHPVALVQAIEGLGGG